MTKISIIASSVRPALYEQFFDSFREETVDYEVIFAGPLAFGLGSFEPRDYPILEYIQTANIKPAQCYEIARRKARGEVIVWAADDCEFRGEILTKAYEYWKSKNDEKLALSLQTREFYLDGGDGFCDMTKHSFIGGDSSTPLMAPLAMISRKLVDEEIGGFDRRFVCGQYENLTICQLYACGGTVEVFGDRESYVEIDHIRKSIDSGESSNRAQFYDRPFATGYKHDRKILEESVIINGADIQIKTFEPYSDKDLFTESQSHKGGWE